MGIIKTFCLRTEWETFSEHSLTHNQPSYETLKLEISYLIPGYLTPATKRFPLSTAGPLYRCLTPTGSTHLFVLIRSNFSSWQILWCLQSKIYFLVLVWRPMRVNFRKFTFFLRKKSLITFYENLKSVIKNFMRWNCRGPIRRPFLSATWLSQQ